MAAMMRKRCSSSATSLLAGQAVTSAFANRSRPGAALVDVRPGRPCLYIRRFSAPRIPPTSRAAVAIEHEQDLEGRVVT